jgi:hypothetical protein
MIKETQAHIVMLSEARKEFSILGYKGYHSEPA